MSRLLIALAILAGCSSPDADALPEASRPAEVEGVTLHVPGDAREFFRTHRLIVGRVRLVEPLPGGGWKAGLSAVEANHGVEGSGVAIYSHEVTIRNTRGVPVDPAHAAAEAGTLLVLERTDDPLTGALELVGTARAEGDEPYRFFERRPDLLYAGP